MGTCNRKNPTSLFLLSLFIILCSFTGSAYGSNRITSGEVIRDGETVISSNQKFALGFFSPGNSTFRYVGIWYHQIPGQTVIWVANRENPISGGNGVLRIGNDGNLVVLNGNTSSVWSTNVSIVQNNSTAAMLMNTGNLILSNNDSIGDLDTALWKSFDDPTDTYLPDMRIYLNVTGGDTHTFTSWKSPNDPSRGRYSMGVDPRGYPQILIWEGQNRRWRSGHWNGLIFIGVPSMRAMLIYGFKLLNDRFGRPYFMYTPSSNSEILHFRIVPEGKEEQLRWDEGGRRWSVMQSQPLNDCDFYNRCGNFGKCSGNGSSTCTCIDGYVPKDPDQWNRGNWSGGCVRRTELECERNNGSLVRGERGGFLKVERVKLPDFVDYTGPENMKDCEERCLRNCSCKGYAYVTGVYCMIWNRDLVDIQHFADGGETLHVRVANSELGDKRKLSTAIIIAIAVAGTCFLIVSICLLWKFKGKLKGSNSSGKNNKIPIYDPRKSGEISTDLSRQDGFSGEGPQSTGAEFVFFNFSCIAEATNHFSLENKLGEGGFGPVYKGTLPGDQEIGVKRLSRRSGQGLEEFKNEITLIAKLQHRNLVRLLGCCIEGEEKMLIYEYMPNKSLDSSLFDPVKQAVLDWKKRFIIIEGIARGILYLHRDSRLRIIHRDLKASNILLDEEMNPKISDFGMARIFGGNQNDEANTIRVVGTYGYMAPEYAMEGFFSGKSDVYSFGILLLEIVSGRKNTSFRSPEYSNIVGYAWNLWESGKPMELVDPSIASSCSQSEVLRCIQVGMLCVQDLAVHRPTMSHVVLMLESENAILPMPKQPTFTSVRSSVDLDAYREAYDMISSNEVTISTVTPR